MNMYLESIVLAPWDGQVKAQRRSRMSIRYRDEHPTRSVFEYAAAMKATQSNASFNISQLRVRL
jgi:hypothetical protein